MSDLASALKEASFKGQVAVREGGLRGMITLRGDFSSEIFVKAATGVTGTDFPGPRRMTGSGEGGLCWMSPDELLVLAPHAQAGAALEKLGKALKGLHHLAVNVSDARAVFTLEGDGAAIRSVLAKLTPADLRPASLPVGEVRRTRFAQVPAAFWLAEEGRAELVCFRSVAIYVFGLLKNAAEPGSEVGYF